MRDVREEILARLLEIVTAIPGIRTSQRNNIDIVELELPAALLFDGDEETHVTDIASGRPGTRPYLPEMTPTISIVLLGMTAVCLRNRGSAAGARHGRANTRPGAPYRPGRKRP